MSLRNVTCRILPSLSLCAAACVVHAQASLNTALGSLTYALQKQGMSGAAATPQNPREPSGFPPLPSKDDSPLPPPRDYGADEKFHAGHKIRNFRQRGEPRSHGRRISDSLSRLRRFWRHDRRRPRNRDLHRKRTCSPRRHGSNRYRHKVTINFHDSTYKAYNGYIDFKPSFFPLGTVLDDVYVNGDESDGSQREMFGKQITITTCNLPEPHFYFVARNADLRPGKRLIMRHVTLYVLKKRTSRFAQSPIPLDSQKNHITPEVGDYPVAGYYIKTWIPIPVHEK